MMAMASPIFLLLPDSCEKAQAGWREGMKEARDEIIAALRARRLRLPSLRTLLSRVCKGLAGGSGDFEVLGPWKTAIFSNLIVK